MSTHIPESESPILSGRERMNALRQMDANTRKTEFSFIISLLEHQCAIEVLSQQRSKLLARQKWADSRLTNALYLGMYVIEDKVDQFAKNIRDFGQLPFAFEGTTVLQGGAA